MEQGRWRDSNVKTLYDDFYDSELKDGQIQNGKVAFINTGFAGSVVDVDVERSKKEDDDNDWKATPVDDDYITWGELTGKEKVIRFFKYIVIIALVLGFLYLFICSLDFLSSAFKLLGGKQAGKIFQQNDIFQNPVAGLMIGVLVTVLVQSSSTSTSIIISMVGSGLLDIRTSIPMIMGANIGTSVTNTIVSLGQIANKSEFRRAFAGATVHDMFNWLTVIILLPLEVISGYLFRLSEAIVNSLPLKTNKGANQEFLKVITKPFTDLIIQINNNIIEEIATGKTDDGSVLKLCCDKVTPKTCCEKDLQNAKTEFGTFDNFTSSQQAEFCLDLNRCVGKKQNATEFCLTQAWRTMEVNGSQQMVFSCANWTSSEKSCLKQCSFLFKGLNPAVNDEGIGAILLVASLILLCLCLVCIVKLLNSMLKGPMARAIKKFVNADFPGRCSYFTGYLAIMVGAGFTLLLQSSSIFTSALTPLVGMGIIELDRMYPLTLGSNIGTTMTGILAALAQDLKTLPNTLQVAFCHLFFNISGIILFYPIPFMRFPIRLAKFLGNETAKYRWFAIVYLVFSFFLFPLAVFALSIPGWYVLAAVMCPIVLLIIIIGIIKVIQRKRPSCLPPKMRNWKWLPQFLRSLEPYDACMQKIMCRCCPSSKADSRVNTAVNSETTRL